MINKEVKVLPNGQMPIPAEVFAAIIGLINAALEGKIGQMEIGTHDPKTKLPGGAIRIVCLPAAFGEVKDSVRTIQIPEVFNNVKHVEPKTIEQETV